jgi:hypothetical protein
LKSINKIRSENGDGPVQDRLVADVFKGFAKSIGASMETVLTKGAKEAFKDLPKISDNMNDLVKAFKDIGVKEGTTVSSNAATHLYKELGLSTPPNDAKALIDAINAIKTDDQKKKKIVQIMETGKASTS